MEISVVVPVYGSPGTLKSLVNRVLTTLSSLTDEFEVILVNDGSPDESWDIIKEISRQHFQVKGVNLSRNFGQHIAIHAGLQSSTGQWIIVMDCDLQDRPEEIAHLYATALEGFNQVVAIRNERKDSYIKKRMSSVFFAVLSFLTDQDLDHRIGNFGIYSRKVIDALLQMGDTTRTFSVLVRWVGFSRATLNVQHDPRPLGESSYSWKRLSSLAARTIVGSSQKPLKLTVTFGLGVSALSIMGGGWIFVTRMLHGVSVAGWSSTMVVMSFLVGSAIACIGIVGLYVGQIFEQVKNRPLYVIDEITES